MDQCSVCTISFTWSSLLYTADPPKCLHVEGIEQSLSKHLNWPRPFCFSPSEANSPVGDDRDDEKRAVLERPNRKKKITLCMGAADSI